MKSDILLFSSDSNLIRNLFNSIDKITDELKTTEVLSASKRFEHSLTIENALQNFPNKTETDIKSFINLTKTVLAYIDIVNDKCKKLDSLDSEAYSNYAKHLNMRCQKLIDKFIIQEQPQTSNIRRCSKEEKSYANNIASFHSKKHAITLQEEPIKRSRLAPK